MTKRFSSYRLSEDCHDLLGAIAERLGLNRTAVIEMAVRNLGRKELGAPPKRPGKSRKKTADGA